MMLEPFSHVAVLAEYAQLPQQGPRDCSPLTASAGGFCKASDGGNL
jgi:hypothetical protein